MNTPAWLTRKPTVMFVDDSADMVETVARHLDEHGFHVEPAASGAAALRRLESVGCDAVLSDLRMPDVDGLDLLEGIRKVDAHLPVVIMTAFGNVDSAVDAIQRGAYHYVTKPFRLTALRLLLERAISERYGRAWTRRQLTASRQGLRTRDLIGRSAAVNELRAFITRVANAPNPVLIAGETGTGKETMARAIHAESDRREAPFVALNCAGALVDSELYGRLPGAFPGTEDARRGLLVAAEGGTLFLDEVGDLSPGLQASLVRILESGELRAVGAVKSRPVNVRFIAATQRDLHALIDEGKFREDLYYRLSVLPVRVPPLRERREDVLLLVDHFLDQHADRAAGPAPRFTQEALRVLGAHHWPGNARELANVVERLIVTSPGADIDAEAVRAVMTPVSARDPVEALAAAEVTLQDLEERYAAAVLRITGGNKAKAASILGIDVSTLYRRDKQRRS